MLLRACIAHLGTWNSKKLLTGYSYNICFVDLNAELLPEAVGQSEGQTKLLTKATVLEVLPTALEKYYCCKTIDALVQYLFIFIKV